MNYTLNGKLLTTGGGPSVPTSFVNTGFSATGAWSYVRPFTATQISGPQYATATALASLDTASVQNSIAFRLTDTSVFPLDNTPAKLTFNGQFQWQIPPDTGKVYGSPTEWDRGTEIGTYTSHKVDTFLTATASFTATAGSFPYYISFDGFYSYSMTAWNTVTATTYTKTGEGKHYPQYPDSTEGVMTASISGDEKWGGAPVYNVYTRKSGSYGTTYDNGPDTSTNVPLQASSIGSFSVGQLKSFITATTYTGIEDTGYTYSYGAITSAYNGYTGI